MAEYKRKNVKKMKVQKPKRSAVAEGYKVTSLSDSDFIEDIAVKSAKESRAERKTQKQKEKYLRKEQPEKRVITSNKTARELNRAGGGLKVVKGTKNIKKVKNITSLITALLIIGCFLLVNAISPTGIVDLVKCSIAKAGSGSGFPVTVSGGNIKNVTVTDGCITVVSDTYIEMYNPYSKELVSEQHKYSNPKSVSSETRTLVYDQGATGVSVYDVSGKQLQRDMKEPIITAAISRNGSYCVVTDPEGIAARMYVYDKNDKLRFKWESETDLINAVAISHNGKYIIAATVNADKGEFSSRFKVFEKNETKPVREELADDVVYSVDAVNRNNFVLRIGNEIKKYSADSGTLFDLTEDTVRQKYCNAKGDTALYTDGGNNEGNITFYNSYFEKKNEINVIASPDSVDWNEEYVVCSYGYSLQVYDYSGKKVDEISANAPIEWFCLSDDNILAINNLAIVNYELLGGNVK